MESDLGTAKRLPAVLYRLLPSIGPVLIISIGYIDPGKWAATIEGGARFGSDLVVPMLVFNFLAIFCQYLSARISLVTGKDLAQICRDEYDRWTCMFLGVQTMLSVIALDLTMILGLAHCLNHLFGVDFSTCLFLTALDTVLSPFLATLLERYKVNFLCTLVAGSLLLLCFLGVLIGQQEVQISVNGAKTGLSVEGTYALMSLLGASVIPHNFYLHSFVVLQYQGLPGISMGKLCQDHFFAILCIFSGIYLVNYVLMISASNVFYNTGLVTFADAMTLMEQVLRSPVASIGFFLIVYFTTQITTLTWNLRGQVLLHDYIGLDIPSWLQRATFRIIAIASALFCVWTSGVEGLYQLLVFTQVIVAVLIPSSLIPLFRVASSRLLMGTHKISLFLEFLTIITIMGILALKIIFVSEMIFGDSDWIGNLRWNMGNSASVPYIVLLVTACLSQCLMLWLAATPLKSATQLDDQVRNWDVQRAVTDPYEHREENFFSDTRRSVEEPLNQELLSTTEMLMVESSDVTLTEPELDLPGTTMDSDELSTSTIEDQCNFKLPNPPECCPEGSSSVIDAAPLPSLVNGVADADILDTKTVKVASMDVVGKAACVVGDLATVKDDEEGDSREPEESAKGLPESTSSLTSDGPAPLSSFSGKSDEGGSGAGSLSRLAGLGRAARRQLAIVLDEFWGQLYDLHGQPSPEAKTRKLDHLWADMRGASSPPKVDSIAKNLTGYFPSRSSVVSEPLVTPSFSQSPKQLRLQNNFDLSSGGSYRSNHMQFLDAYVQGSSHNSVDAMERRYSSLRSLPLSSYDGWENHPAPVHSYHFSSIVNRIAEERNSSYLHSQRDASSFGPTDQWDSHPFLLGQKTQKEYNSPQTSKFHNLTMPRNDPLQSERSYSVGTKKYHSLPDISGLSVPYKGIYMSEKGNQGDSSVGFGSSAGRTRFEPSFSSCAGSGSIGSLAFNELSRGYGDSFSFPLTSDSGSIWSKQPFEQFGTADKNRAVGVGINRSISATNDACSPADAEAQLLQSFRCCILKLLKLEGSDWLFKQNDGTDENLIDRVAARESCLYEAETREVNCVIQSCDPPHPYYDRKSASASKNDEAALTNVLVSSILHCGEGCVWKVDLIVSFGVWCIHRILEFSLTESRPELWGKYTYVLNRLQGIIDPAFSKPRTPMSPCFCLQLSVAHQQRLSPLSNGMLPPASKPGKGKSTTAAMLLDLIKDVEIAISCRRGRSGTAAGDHAFSRGKENLASVLKRYKRRLSNKPVGGK